MQMMIVPVFVNIINREIEKDTSPAVATYATAVLVGGIISNFLNNFEKGIVRDYWRTALVNAVNEIAHNDDMLVKMPLNETEQ